MHVMASLHGPLGGGHGCVLLLFWVSALHILKEAAVVLCEGQVVELLLRRGRRGFGLSGLGFVLLKGVYHHNYNKDLITK